MKSARKALEEFYSFRLTIVPKLSLARYVSMASEALASITISGKRARALASDMLSDEPSRKARKIEHIDLTNELLDGPSAASGPSNA